MVILCATVIFAVALLCLFVIRTTRTAQEPVDASSSAETGMTVSVSRQTEPSSASSESEHTITQPSGFSEQSGDPSSSAEEQTSASVSLPLLVEEIPPVRRIENFLLWPKDSDEYKLAWLLMEDVPPIRILIEPEKILYVTEQTTETQTTVPETQTAASETQTAAPETQTAASESPAAALESAETPAAEPASGAANQETAGQTDAAKAENAAASKESERAENADDSEKTDTSEVFVQDALDAATAENTPITESAAAEISTESLSDAESSTPEAFAENTTTENITAEAPAENTSAENPPAETTTTQATAAQTPTEDTAADEIPAESSAETQTSETTSAETTKAPVEIKIPARYMDAEGSVSLYYKDLCDGETLVFNPDEIQYAASMIKIVYIYALLSAADKDEADLDQTVIYNAEKMYQTGSGNFASVADGTEFSVWELIEHAVVYSDNTAYGMLLNLYGYRLFTDAMEEAGLPSAYRNWWRTPVGQYGQFFEVLYGYLTSGSENGDKLCGLMCRSTQTVMLKNALKPEKVAHKYGWDVGSYCDGAVALNEAHPYIVVFMSNLDEGHIKRANTEFIYEAGGLIKRIHDKKYEEPEQEEETDAETLPL